MQIDFELVLRRPIETTALIRHLPRLASVLEDEVARCTLAESGVNSSLPEFKNGILVERVAL